MHKRAEGVKEGLGGRGCIWVYWESRKYMKGEEERGKGVREGLGRREDT